MFIDYKVTECDFTNKQYGRLVDGVGAIAQGASGRWCVVMWGGPEYKARLIAEGTEILDEDEARARIDASGNGWADF